ncbi:hypothetical protein JK185_03670 [Gluconobacter wancherniae]|uniref:hypothetical protein n=1 Tax=Gluconobacter wancherniae TaxID=1307955 RepID=UPI001B8BB626|nr:hypothetical protein [Gluconobacter wancherniae]MBS1062152.1 hypothetical protein [Gluconobacter wancherniae]
MSVLTVAVLLIMAACLEVGGDALVRHGLHGSTILTRALSIFAGGLVLLVYGVVVNLPPWDFGRLMGVYVALFFIVAQAVAFFAFGEVPGVGICAGGALIISGGIVMTVWR